MKNIFILIVLILAFTIPSFAAEEIYVWEDENGQMQTSKTKPDGWESRSYEKVMSTKRERALRIMELSEEAAEVLNYDIPKKQKCTRLRVIQQEVDNLIEEQNIFEAKLTNVKVKAAIDDYCKGAEKKSKPKRGSNIHIELQRKE